MKAQYVFHASDLMRALEAQPHELRTWLKLEPFCSREKKRRAATAYSTLDALFLAVIKKLDAAGFAPKALQTFSASLYKALQHPPVENEPDEVFLHRKGDGGWKIGKAPVPGDSLELRIPMLDVRLHILRYTGAHLLSPQLEMALLAAIPSKPLRSVNSASGVKRALR